MEEHKLWLESDGKKGRKADLSGSDLCKRNLNVGILFGVDLQKKDLRKADLRKADLFEADLREADLRGADLRGAKLRNVWFNEETKFFNAKIDENTELDDRLRTLIEKQRAIILPQDKSENENNNEGGVIPPQVNAGIENSDEGKTKSLYKMPAHPTRFETKPCFNVENISHTFADHLLVLGDNAEQMLGIFGRWGAGKTYFVKQVEKQLRDKNSRLRFVTFSAWKYQATPAVWAHLYETIFKAYAGNSIRRKFRYYRSRHRFWYVKPLVLLLACVLGSYALLAKEAVGSHPAWLKFLIGITGTLLVFYTSYSHLVESTYLWIKDIGRRKKFHPHMGVQLEVERELAYLLKQWEKEQQEEPTSKLILFIDDLDRCSLERIVELIDSLRVVLENPDIKQRMVVLAAIDERRLVHAIREKLAPSESENGHLNAAVSEYIDKLFLSGIKIAPLCSEKRKEYAHKLIDEDKSIEVDEDESVAIENDAATPSISNASKESGVLSQVTTSEGSEQGEAEKVPVSEQPQYIRLSRQKLKELVGKEVPEFGIEMSPRQVRIFYYRLRLAINLYGIYQSKVTDDILDSIAQTVRLQTEANYGIGKPLEAAQPMPEGEQHPSTKPVDQLQKLFSKDDNLRKVVEMVVCY